MNRSNGNFHIRTPAIRIIIFTNILIHLSVYAYLLIDPRHINSIDKFYFKFGLVPAEFLINGAFWQPVTAMFIHALFISIGPEAKIDGDFLQLFLSLFSLGLLHIGVNMVGLWSLGRILESTLGTLRFLLLYFISGILGSIVVILVNPDLTQPTVGASGALLGLLGGLALFYPRLKLLIFFIPMKSSTAALIIAGGSFLFLFMGKGGFISHAGHLGGLLGGIIISWLILHFYKSINYLKPATTHKKMDPENSHFNEKGVDLAVSRLHYNSKVGNYYLQ